jgi:diaminohydroxyphosphoribosylaminopyrimidine deaminase/5-amino-6-(5-phosphoribosylamino)uracil reductase
VSVLVLPARRGRVSLRALVTALGRLGVMHVVCEGGATIAGSLQREGLVDGYLLFYAPRILGGAGTPGGFDGTSWPLHAAPALRIDRVSQLGADILVAAAPKAPPKSTRRR